MEYISSKQAAKKWRLSVRQVQICCAKGKINGAKYMGKQWIIPKNASRPADGRTKKAKIALADTLYHFPLMIFSPLYTYHADCTDLEMVLLKAQILNLEGNYLKSVNLSKYILKNTTDNYLAMGAYCTMAYSYLFQDDFSKLKIALLDMSDLYKKEEIHKEDFKLIIESLKFMLTFNGDNIYKLDPSQMSSEALTFFECILNITNIFKQGINPEIDCIKTAILTKRLDLDGFEPLVLLSALTNSTLQCIKVNEYSSDFDLPICKEITLRNNWGSYYDRMLFLKKKMLDLYRVTNDIQIINFPQDIDCWVTNSKNYQ